MTKAHRALEYGCHLLIIDLFPPGAFDPEGIQAAIWADLDPDESVSASPDAPFTIGAYAAEKFPEAEIERIGVGDSLPDMPLFLHDGFINTPLEDTYQIAYRGVPEFWRQILEKSA